MLKYALVAAALFGAYACDSKIEDLESTKQTSNVATTEANGVVTGSISPSATTDQILVASPSSKVADTSVTFPPGSLAIAVDVSLGQATDKSTAILAELGVTNAVKAGDPVYVGPAAGTPPDLVKPLTIQMPLPLEETGTTGLVAGESKLVLVYTIYDNGWKSGMIPVTSANLIGAFLKQALNGFGYFQIVYLAAAAVEKEAVASSVTPVLNGQTSTEEEEKDDTQTTEPAAVTCTGDASGDLEGRYSYIVGCRTYKRNSNDGNNKCAYALDALMKVGVNGDGAISLVDPNAVKTTGVMAQGFPAAFADTVTSRWSLPNAQDAARSEVTLSFDENTTLPLVPNAMKIDYYTAGSVSSTCYFSYVSTP